MSAWRRRAADLQAREVERVGAAIAGGALPELMAGLDPRAHLDDTTLVLPDDHENLTLRLGVRGLVLHPMLCPMQRIVVQHDGSELTHLAYPLPGAARLLDPVPDHAPEPDGLDALVGPMRARVLRLLDRPLAAGGLASRLGSLPSSVTRHVEHLERAGLVHRERRGQRVLVHRTSRGSSLLALFGP